MIIDFLMLLPDLERTHQETLCDGWKDYQALL